MVDPIFILQIHSSNLALVLARKRASPIERSMHRHGHGALQLPPLLVLLQYHGGGYRRSVCVARAIHLAPPLLTTFSDRGGIWPHVAPSLTAAARGSGRRGARLLASHRGDRGRRGLRRARRTLPNRPSTTALHLPGFCARRRTVANSTERLIGGRGVRCASGKALHFKPDRHRGRPQIHL
jgi:hypothetical protein